MKKKQRKNVFRYIAIGICLVIFCFSAYQLVTIFLEYQAGQKEYKGLEQYITSEITPSSQSSHSVAAFAVNYEKLREINSDIVGWIRIADTTVNYPILQTTDNEYYLRKTFEKNYNIAGSIFMDYRNQKDFSDLNTLIYGHHIKNGTMFADLRHYEKEEFYRNHPTILLNTPNDGNQEYEIFSFYVTGEYRDTYQQTYQTTFSTSKEYESYLAMIKSQSKYDTGIEVSADDRIITLSTCTNRTEDERYIVHARLKRPQGLS